MQRWTRRGRSLKSPWRRIRVACQQKISRSRNSKTRVMKKTKLRDHCVVENPLKKKKDMHFMLCCACTRHLLAYVCAHTHTYIYMYAQRHVCAHTWTNMHVSHTYTYTYTYIWCGDTQTLHKCMHKHQWSSLVNCIYKYTYMYTYIYRFAHSKPLVCPRDS